MITRHASIFIAAFALLLAGCTSDSPSAPRAGYAAPRAIFDMSRMAVAEAHTPMQAPMPPAVAVASVSSVARVTPRRSRKALDELCPGGECGVPEAQAFFEKALPPVKPQASTNVSDLRAALPGMFEGAPSRLTGTRDALTPASDAFDLAKLDSRSLYGRAWKRNRDLSAVSIGLRRTLRDGSRLGYEIAVDPFASEGRERAVFAIELSKQF